MVVIVGSSGYFPMKKKFTAALLEKHPEINYLKTTAEKAGL